MKDINWERVVTVFNSISTTSTRIYFTLLIIAATAADYLLTGQVPDGSWLLFLGTLAGVDMAQAAIKTVAVSAGKAKETVAVHGVRIKELEVENKKLSVNATDSTLDLEKEKG